MELSLDFFFPVLFCLRLRVLRLSSPHHGEIKMLEDEGSDHASYELQLAEVLLVYPNASINSNVSCDMRPFGRAKDKCQHGTTTNDTLDDLP